MRQVGKSIAVLALAKARQEEGLLVRQREQLRRALAEAGDHLAWADMAARKADPVAEASSDVTRLTKAGVRQIESDLAEELAAKKAEITQLKRVARALEKMAGQGEDAFPAEVEFHHSARDGYQELVTKTQTLTLEEPSEAQAAADKIMKRIESWTKLRDEMIQELHYRQKRVDEMKKNLSEFVASLHRLLGEVLVTLY